MTYVLLIILAALAIACGATSNGAPSFNQFCEYLGSNSPSFAQAESVIITGASYVPIVAANVSGISNAIAFCRVFGGAPYALNNTVKYEVWLPEPTSYNGRLLVVGNGGMAGTIDASALLMNLNNGYASAGGDSGHAASDNNDGQGKPGTYLSYLHSRDQTLAWIHNSVAYMTPPAKSIVKAAYEGVPTYTYYQGCSTGGAQGFALAQYHPHLFDGIVAGSPGNWYSHLALSFLWNYVDNQSSFFLPQDALELITNGVLDQCDALDGVVDRVVEDPLSCHFDIASLQCSSPGTESSPTPCLRPGQVSQARKLYSGPRNAHTGAVVYPGFSFGSESEWEMQESQLADSFSIPILQNLVFDDLEYKASGFDWAEDIHTVDRRAGTLIDEISPDLSAFSDRGGKMVVTQGWADPYNAAVWPIQHREQLQSTMKGDIDDWFALFMVPGGGHCGAASTYPQVPAEWHSLDSLVSWVERGQKPEHMLSTSPSDESNRTRKLCPWPATAKYRGGNIDSWTSYSCRDAV